MKLVMLAVIHQVQVKKMESQQVNVEKLIKLRTRLSVEVKHLFLSQIKPTL